MLLIVALYSCMFRPPDRSPAWGGSMLLTERAHAVQVLALLMQSACYPKVQQLVAASSKDGALNADRRCLLKQTLESVLQLSEEPHIAAAPASKSGSRHMHTQATAQAGMSACGKAAHDDGEGSAAYTMHGKNGLAVHAVCFALLRSISMESSATTELNCNGIAERHMHEVLPPPDVAGRQLGMRSAAMHVPHPSGSKSCTPGSDFTESDNRAHAWNVVQCLLLDFLCGVVRLQGSQGLGSIASRVKKFCQQHIPQNNAAGTRLTGPDRDRQAFEPALDTDVAELWSYRVSWVLNVRLSCTTLCFRHSAEQCTPVLFGTHLAEQLQADMEASRQQENMTVRGRPNTTRCASSAAGGCTIVHRGNTVAVQGALKSKLYSLLTLHVPQ